MHALARVPVLLVALLIAAGSLATPMNAFAQNATEAAATEAAAAETGVAAAETATVQLTATAEPATTADETATTETDVATEAAATPTATSTPGPQEITVVVTNDATSTPLDPAMVLALVLVLLLVALFALSEIFRYLREGRVDYYQTFRELARKGVYAVPHTIGPVVRADQPAAPMAEGALAEPGAPPAPPDQFAIFGPKLLTVDEPGVFTAFVNGSPALATQWVLTTPEGSAVPAADATLSSQSGSTTTFTGLKPGIYHLTPTPPGIPTTITVVEPPAAAATPSLPFIGEGYGSIVGAILLLAVVVVLAAARAIDADVIGVLLGSIAGYLFGVGVSKTSS